MRLCSHQSSRTVHTSSGESQRNLLNCRGEEKKKETVSYRVTNCLEMTQMKTIHFSKAGSHSNPPTALLVQVSNISYRTPFQRGTWKGQLYLHKWKHLVFQPSLKAQGGQRDRLRCHCQNSCSLLHISKSTSDLKYYGGEGRLTVIWLTVLVFFNQIQYMRK